MKEIFNQHNHYLSYEVDDRNDLTIGITTRQGGYSPYPENAFNMARYINDDQIIFQSISKY